MLSIIIGAIIAAVGLAIGVYFKFRAGNASGALKDIGALFNVAAETIDDIKQRTAASGEGRGAVKGCLKSAGRKLEEGGLKDLMDLRLKALGLNDKS